MHRPKIILVFLLLITSLFSSQIDDLRFAIGLYSDGNYNLARIELAKFIEENPESNFINDARFLLANSLLSLQNYQGSLREYERLDLPDLSPAVRSDVLLGKAQCYYFLDNHQKAEKFLMDFLDINPNHELKWKAEFFLGMIAAASDNHQKALEFFQSAGQQYKDPFLDVALLKSLLALNKQQEADKLVAGFDLSNEQFEEAILIYNNYNLQNGFWQKIIDTQLPRINKSSLYYSDYFLLRGIAFYNLQDFDSSLSELKKSDGEKSDYYKALCLYEQNEINQAEQILLELQNSNNEEIKANSFFYLTKIEDDENKKEQMLQKFLQLYPESEFSPLAYYLLGYNNFKKDKFNKALNFFEKAEKKAAELDSKQFEQSYQGNTTFLIAESQYQIGNSKTAVKNYQKYLDQFPNGNLKDEAIFKLGLINFENNKLDVAAEDFSKLVATFVESTKRGMSHYYLGEINFRRDKLDQALDHFNKALQGEVDLGYTWERIARIHFRKKSFQRCLESLENIPNESRYLFEKFLLEGNANFAIRKLEKALQAFEFAEEYAVGEQAVEIALSRKALTLYQMKRFKEASQLYSRLSSSASSPQQYLIKAANAAFSAEDFLRAIEIYRQFTENYKDSDDIPSAILGIADSYYNLGDFVSAAQQYRRLITPESDNKLLNNALNGLRWSAEQHDDVDYLSMIDELLTASNVIEFRLELLNRKLLYLYSKSQWEQAIEIAAAMEKLLPENELIPNAKLIKALSLAKIKDFESAETVFQQLGDENPSAEILFNWALLKLELTKTDEALEKLRQAVQLTRRMDVWLQLLELEIETNHIYFQNDLARFREFAENEYSELADVFLLEWKINNGQTELDDDFKKLSKSKNNLIKAHVQYLQGYKLFKVGQLEDAVPELLRVRYLYPEFTDIRLKSEKLALNAYIMSQRKEEAVQLLETIRNDLTEQERSVFRSRLQQEEE